MNGLFRFISRLFGGGRSGALYIPPAHVSPSPQAPTANAVAPGAPPPPSPPTPDSSVVFLDLAEDEDIADDPEDESDEPDPTVGRYEELHVEILVAEEIDAQRAAAEAEGLSGPHKIFPHDPAGPGSLAETLARLEAEGRLTSRVCDDDEAGFYVLYEPASNA